MSNQVTIYSTPTCQYCILAKGYFAKHNITVQDIDVSTDQAAAQEMIDKSGQMAVPVVDINGQIVVGFQPTVFEALLKGGTVHDAVGAKV